MGRADILICPGCDYKRHLTEAESRFSYALVVACFKCGSAMQCTQKRKPAVQGGSQTFPDSSTRMEAKEDWAVT